MVDLTPHNTLRLPAKAEKLVEIHSKDQAKKAFKSGVFESPHLILGLGANVLFTKDFPGSVILTKIHGQKLIKETSDFVQIEFGAGENWDHTVRQTVDNNWSGMENMVMIPGTVGAAAVGNIAAYGQNQEDIFVSLKALNLKTGKFEVFKKKDMEFTYRESLLKNKFTGQYLVTSVTYQLSKVTHLELSYHTSRHASLLPELQKIAQKPYTIKDVSQAVINMRSEKLPDITKIGTAGSFFKNPLVDTSLAHTIKAKIPDLQLYPADKLSYIDPNSSEPQVKIPAGMLLDYLGWRGKRIGDVGTYPTHALIICNFGQATGPQVYEFSQSMKQDVKNNFGINLDYEVVTI